MQQWVGQNAWSLPVKMPSAGGNAGLRSTAASPSAQRRQIDDPAPGYFTIKLIKGGPRVPARLHMDLTGYWAEIDGKRCGAASEDPLQADGVMRVWLYGREIDQVEYAALLGRADKPDPRKPVDLRKLAPIQF